LKVSTIIVKGREKKERDGTIADEIARKNYTENAIVQALTT